MNIETQKFLAREKADIDWQKVGGNENPYLADSQPEARQAYDDRFEQISFEWQSFTRHKVLRVTEPTTVRGFHLAAGSLQRRSFP